MTKRQVIVVDDDSVVRSSLRGFLENRGFSVHESNSVKDAIKHDLKSFDLIVTELKPGGSTGTDLINLAPNTPVIITTTQASLRSAVECMKLGAADYLAKPYDFEELYSILGEITSKDAVASVVQILGTCDAIQKLNEQIEKVSPTDTNILIEGESGTGKELIARKLHNLSSRSNRKMIALNCAAIPDNSIEVELFGESLSDSTTSGKRVGLVESADGSTLFLDEVGDLPLAAQARLLRFLEDDEVRRVGGVEARKISVRLIAATQRNLQRLVEQGEFREDLYYRLNVVKLGLPPLRERDDDLLLLAEHFLSSNANQHNKSKLRFSDAAIKTIKAHRWPGNIRELENAIKRAVILCESKSIPAELLAVEKIKTVKLPESDSDSENMSLTDYFVKFVTENQDQMTETELASKLGISRKSLWQKRQKLGIPRERSRNQ